MDQGVSRPADIFGIHIFDKTAMKERLSEDVYKRLMMAVEGGGKLDKSLADFVASAMKSWALSLGVTHYAHWFQPRNEVTAEKHMAFLSLDGEGNPIHSFTGKELIMSEPDASSFPSGGMRSTFEARGYCMWDPSSPAFIILSHKGGTLCIPSVFISYDGTSLDMKTPLLKSIDEVSNRAMRLLKLFGNRSVRSVKVTIGAEQEFFLIDEDKALKRPDLNLCRRTIIGAPSPKAQTMEAHYFGAIHPRVLAYMEDVERDMYRLGQVIMTRHNEAAPGQFEFAPVLAEANRGCDQNQMLMEVMRKMARRHHFRLILHEKPFESVNGSGKHLNVSLCDSEGRNLLKPSSNPRRNVQFLSFICSFLLGVSRYGGLMRASVASAGNAQRLGGHEAPPSVMSVYVGTQLDHALSNLAEKEPEDVSAKGLIDLGMGRLPTLDSDKSDRNRTSPIAFTGNKWEFRAVGSAQSLGGPLSILLAIWSDGIERFADALEKRMVGGEDVIDAALAVIREAWEESANVRFEGNGYDAEWLKEAERRGLPVCRNTVEALDQYLCSPHCELLERLGIMSIREIRAYHEVRLEQYADTTALELNVLRNMMYEGILPAISRQIIRESQAISALPPIFEDELTPWREKIEKLARLKCSIMKNLNSLDKLTEKLENMEVRERAECLGNEGERLGAEIRKASDIAEKLIAADLQPYPGYTDMFMIRDFND